MLTHFLKITIIEQQMDLSAIYCIPEWDYIHPWHRSPPHILSFFEYAGKCKRPFCPPKALHTIEEKHLWCLKEAKKGDPVVTCPAYIVNS